MKETGQVSYSTLPVFWSLVTPTRNMWHLKFGHTWHVRECVTMKTWGLVDDLLGKLANNIDRLNQPTHASFEDCVTQLVTAEITAPIVPHSKVLQLVNFLSAQCSLCYYCDNLLSKQHKPKHVSVHSGSLSCHRYKSSSHSGHEFGRDQYSMSSKQPIKKWWSFWTKLIISHCGLALTLHRGN